MVSGWFECNGLVRFGRWVVWMVLGWLCLVDGWFGLGLGWFWVVLFVGFNVLRTGLVESKGLGWYWVGLGNKWVVWVVTVWFEVVFG